MMMPDGRGWLYAPAGLLDGPMPTHYEPIESPVANLLYPEIDSNPVGAALAAAGEPVPPGRRPALPGRRDDLPPHRAPHRGRDEPRAAVAGRAAARDVLRDRGGARAPSAGSRTAAGMTIVTERAEIEARARVTERMQPLRVDGRRVHQIALPWHWGYGGEVTGDTANDLGALSGRPERDHPGVQGVHVRRARRAAVGRGDRAARGRAARPARRRRTRTTSSPRSRRRPRSSRPSAPSTRPDAERMGFFTDTTVCIGCKACEVACKQWNDLPADERRVRARARRTTSPAS